MGMAELLTHGNPRDQNPGRGHSPRHQTVSELISRHAVEIHVGKDPLGVDDKVGDDRGMGSPKYAAPSELGERPAGVGWTEAMRSAGSESEESFELRDAQTIECEKDERANRELIAKPEGHAPERRGFPKQQVIERSVQEIEGRAHQLSEVIDNADLRTQIPQGKSERLSYVLRTTSYAIANVSTQFSTDAAARSLTTRVLPVYQAADWTLRRVLTDRGQRGPRGVRSGLYRPGVPPHPPGPAPPPLDQRCRGARAGDRPHRTVAYRVPPAVLHPRPVPAGGAGALPGLLPLPPPNLGYRTRGRLAAELVWAVAGRRDHDHAPEA